MWIKEERTKPVKPLVKKKGTTRAAVDGAGREERNEVGGEEENLA